MDQVMDVSAPSRAMGQPATMTPDALYKLTKVLVQYIQPSDLHIISCCSKLAGEVCRAVALSSNEAPRLLRVAVKEAASWKSLSSQPRSTAVASQQQKRICGAVLWLLSLDPDCAKSQPEELIQIHNVPAELAAVLVKAGSRVTHQMLVTAAKQRVAGAEVQHQLAVTTDIDPVTEMLCCEQLAQQLPPPCGHSTIPSLLSLAEVRAHVEEAAADPKKHQQLLDYLHVAINCQQITWSAQALVQATLQLDIQTMSALSNLWCFLGQNGNRPML